MEVRISTKSFFFRFCLFFFFVVVVVVSVLIIIIFPWLVSLYSHQGCTSTSQTDDATAITDLTDIVYWYFVLVPAKCTKFRKVSLIERFQQEGGVRVCVIACPDNR